MPSRSCRSSFKRVAPCTVVALILLGQTASGQVLLRDEFDDNNPAALQTNPKGIGGGFNTSAFGGRIFGENGADSGIFGTTAYSFGGGDFANSELNSQLTNIPVFGSPAKNVDWRVSFAGIEFERAPDPGEQAFPGGAAADLRHEFGIVSANRSNAEGSGGELFLNNNGGVYVTLFYDRAGNAVDNVPLITGNIRVTTKNKAVATDMESEPGLVTVGTFSLGTRLFDVGQDDGLGDDFITSLTLGSNGFSVSFRDDDGTLIVPTLLSGSLGVSDWNNIASSRPDLSAETVSITDELNNGFYVHALTSNLAGGRGAADLGSITVTQVPEPASLAILALTAGIVVRYRRA